MSRTSLVLLGFSLLGFFWTVPLARAAQQTSFEWSGTFQFYSSATRQPSGDPAIDKSSQWFPTVASCNADMTAFMTDPNHNGNFYAGWIPPLICSCDQAIYLQPSCPDFRDANRAVTGQIPLNGACQQSSQCAANLTCGSSKICIAGNPPTGTVNPPGNPGGTVSPPASPAAQTTANTGQNVQLINPLSGSCTPGQDCLLSFLKSVLSLVTRVGTVAIILMLVYIGFLFATTSVNPKNKEQAKQYLLWTIIGALVILGAQAIANGISATVQALSTGG